jgi:hypothetical protein
MNKNWLEHSFAVIAAAALMSGCAGDVSVGPDRTPGLAASTSDVRGADLGSCQNLQVEAGNKLAFQTYAKGVQIYHWNGAAWSFDGPSAVLSADPAGASIVGSHYSGPTWESMSGSKVVASVLQRCTPDANSIPWLLLGAVSSEGPGVFDGVTFIQRVNTAGGNPPAQAGAFVGEEARVPYTTEYLFYRPE